MAVQVLVLRVGRQVVQKLVIAAERHAAVQRPEGPAAPAHVRQIDVHRFPVHGLERVYIHRAVAHVDVYQHLRRVPDAGCRLKRVPAAQEREIRHRVQLVQIGTGDAEKVAHHLVRVPGDLQLRKAVEDIERVRPLLSYPVINIHGEGFKALHRVELEDLEARLRAEELLVPGIVHVDEVPAVLESLPREGLCKDAVFLELRHLPDHVVAHADIVKYLIHTRVAARYPLKRHDHRLLKHYFPLFYYTSSPNSPHFSSLTHIFF